LTSARPQIVFFHPSDELYGADRVVLEMLRAVQPDLSVEVWLPDDLAHPPADASLCARLAADGVRVCHLRLPILRRAYKNPRGLAALTGRSVRLIRRIRSQRPDLVYCTTSAALLCAPAARIAGVHKVIGHFQEVWSRSDAYLLTVPARTCRRLLSISGAVADSLPRGLRARTAVVPNGTAEPPRVLPLEGRTGELQFLVASRWNGWKGHQTLLDAWDRAGAPGRLVVLGGPPRSGDWVDVHALVAGLQKPDSVSVVGEVADPSSYLEAADVVVLPSDQPEPFGLVAIEAFARARPVIASAAGGPLEIVTPGSDGWLFPPGDAESLAKVLAGLTRPEVEAAGRHARRTYQSRYTLDHFVEQWRRAVLPLAI
jgi:glycosyltransferase involved in cell wall biosynthesis